MASGQKTWVEFCLMRSRTVPPRPCRISFEPSKGRRGSVCGAEPSPACCAKTASSRENRRRLRSGRRCRREDRAFAGSHFSPPGYFGLKDPPDDSTFVALAWSETVRSGLIPKSRPEAGPRCGKNLANVSRGRPRSYRAPSVRGRIRSTGGSPSPGFDAGGAVAVSAAAAARAAVVSCSFSLCLRNFRVFSKVRPSEAL